MFKRIFDIVVSGAVIICCIPAFIVIAIAIRLDSSGPILFRQYRVGKNQQLFAIHKFRTMNYVQDKGDSLLTIGEDLRITRVGKYLRRLKIDELPQFIDVFIGKMSIVGPRPEVPDFVNYYSQTEKDIIFSICPGITDLASVQFIHESTILAKSVNPKDTYIHEILPIKIGLYVEYVKNRSFMLDMKIIWLTLTSIMRNIF